MHSKIVNEALTWLDTKFKHQGRRKKDIHRHGGCDCLGLIIGIAKKLELKTINGEDFALFDQDDYAQIINTNMLHEQMNQLLYQVDISAIQPGDLLLLRINHWPSHLAIVTQLEPLIIIHSYIQARKIVQQLLSPEWQAKIVTVYRFSSV